MKTNEKKAVRFRVYFKGKKLSFDDINKLVEVTNTINDIFSGDIVFYQGLPSMDDDGVLCMVLYLSLIKDGEERVGLNLYFPMDIN